MTAPRPQQPLRRDGGEPPRTPACCYRTDFHRLGVPEDHVGTPLEATGDDLSDAAASEVSAEGRPADGPTEAHAAVSVTTRAARLIQGDNTVLPSLAAEAAARRLGEAGLLVGQYGIKAADHHDHIHKSYAALDIPPRVPVPPWPTREEWEAKVTTPLLARRVRLQRAELGDEALADTDDTPHVPGEADPEWRHWAKGEIQRLRDAFLEVAHEAESLTVERDDAVTGQAYWKDRALSTENAYDAASAGRDRARDVAARLENELAEQTFEWGVRFLSDGKVYEMADEHGARDLSPDSFRPSHVVSRRVGPWTEEA